MKLFRIYVDGKLFYHPHLSRLAVTEAKIEEDAENIDCLTISAPYNHPYISVIKPLSSVIICKKGDETVFEGRSLDEGSDLYNTHSWTCESALAYLKDSVQMPYDYQGELRGLLEYFIEEHNKCVEEQKRFTVGEVTVTDSNDYISYRSSNYSKTLDAIKEKLLNTHGGYLRLRYTPGGKVLDYLSDFTESSLQKVEFGKNIIDVKLTCDHTERVTALIPLGAEKVDEEGNATGGRIDITSVNDGKNYVTDEETVKEAGWIWKTEVWEDVTLPANLLTKAKARIADLAKGITRMELTIADESDADADICDIHAGQYVYCSSPPHGIDGRYLCLQRTRDYLNPSGNTVTIGASGISLSSLSAKQSRNLEQAQQDFTGRIEEVSSSAAAEAEELREEIHEYYSELTKTAEEIKSEVAESYLSKSALESIQEDFLTSITQSSDEIRMDFIQVTNEIINNMTANQTLLEEYIRFKGALIELGRVGNAFTAELSNEELAFKEDGLKIAYISNQQLVITNAEIRNKLSLGNAERGWFDFLPRSSGNVSVVWRGPSA